MKEKLVQMKTGGSEGSEWERVRELSVGGPRRVIWWFVPSFKDELSKMRPCSHKNRVFWLFYAFVKRPLIGRIKWRIKRVVQDVERKNEGSGG